MTIRLTDPLAEQQPKQCALIHAYDPLEHKIIWGQIDILVVTVRMLSRSYIQQDTSMRGRLSHIRAASKAVVGPRTFRRIPSRSKGR